MYVVKNPDNIENEVIEAIRQGALLDDKPVSMENTLEDLEIDSLDITNVSFEVEDRLGVVLEVEDLENIKTVSDLTALIRSRLADGGNAA